MEIQGKISNIIYQSKDTGYIVATLETEDALVDVVGILPGCNLYGKYVFHGDFYVNEKYGEQFKFIYAQSLMPEGEEEIIQFLSSGLIKGIGHKLAVAIVEKFGIHTIDVLDNEIERLLDVTGIGKSKIESIKNSYKEHREFANVSLELQRYSISLSQANKLYRVYGKDAAKIIKENPYALIDEVYGIGFKKADLIASRVGIDKNNPFRIKSGIEYILSIMSGQGHTYVPKSELLEHARTLMDISSEQGEDILVEEGYEGNLVMTHIEGTEAVYLPHMYFWEKMAANKIRLLKNGDIKYLNVDVETLIRATEEESGIALSEEQKSTVKNSLTHGISVITGGPGTGKTTIINALIDIFAEGNFNVKLCAPTGRAAKRINETSGREALTIHRLLEYSFSDDTGKMSFGKNHDDPLEGDVFIVDESSMIDLQLLYALLDAIPVGKQLIFVGDYKQLPSVGAGNVLRDIIESDYVYTSKLTSIFRQAAESNIVVNAHRIDNGEEPIYQSSSSVSDFYCLERGKPEDISYTILDLVTKRLPDFYEDLDPKKDIQVLTPMRKNSLGSIALNSKLQERLNPRVSGREDKQIGERILRCGDKVMQIKNNYNIVWHREDDFSEGKGIFNGDLGYIKNIDQDNQKLTVIFDGDKLVTYDFDKLDEIELAYAMTIHKSQGSEFPVVIIPIAGFPPMLATRNLLYTGVTRGKKLVILVGEKNKVMYMVNNNRENKRYSGLKSRLKEMDLLDKMSGN